MAASARSAQIESLFGAWLVMELGPLVLTKTFHQNVLEAKVQC